MNYYETYIGSTTVKEFLQPFGGDIDKAIAQVIEQWPWDDGIPDDFPQIIKEYCEQQLSE